MNQDQQTHTVSSLARQLRGYAELTAANTKNWDNFQEIVESALQQTFEAGKTARTEEKTS